MHFNQTGKNFEGKYLFTPDSSLSSCGHLHAMNYAYFILS